MVEVAKLIATIAADTEPLEKGLSRADSLVRGFGGALGNVGALAFTGAVAGLAGVAAGAVVATKQAGDLEQTVANISTIKPEIDTSAVFAALNEMQTRVPQSAAQLGESLYNVFSSIDVSQAEALKLTQQFAQGAVGAQTDAQTFGTAVLGVMNAYKLSVEDAAHVSDVFFNTVKLGVVTGPELAGSLGVVTQAAKAAGVDFDTLGGLIAGVTKEGGPAAQNINNLANMLAKINSADAQKGFTALGISIADTSGQIRTVPAILDDLKGALAGLTEVEQLAALQKIFPDMQARQGAQVLLSQLGFVHGAIESNIQDSGSAADAFTKMNATFNSQAKILGNTFNSILTTVGAELLPTVTPVVKAFAEDLPGAFAAARTSIGPLLAQLGPILGAAFQVLKDTVITVGQVFQRDWSIGLNAAGESIQPFTAAVGVAATFVRDTLIPAISAAVVWLGANLPPVISWLVTTGWPALVTAAGGISTWWTSTGQPAFAAIVDFLGTNLPPVLTWISATGWPAIVTAGEAVAAKVQEVQTNFGLLVAEMDKRGVFTDLQQIWSDLTTVAGLFTTELGHSTEGMTSSDGKAAILSASIQGAATSFKQVTGDIASATGALRAFAQWCVDAKEKLGALVQLMNGNAGIIEQGQAAARLLGISIPQGAAQGVRQGTPEFTAAVGDMSQQGVDVLHDSWAAHSPSQVAADVGFSIALGLAQGIAKGDSVVAESVLAITKNAIKNNIDPLIALALAKAESGFNTRAIGDQGHSGGLFQLHDQGQGAGMSMAQRQDPWVNAGQFLAAHAQLFQQLKAEGLAGEQLAATFGRLAEVSDPQFAHRYAEAYRELVAQFGAAGPAVSALAGANQQLTATQQQATDWAKVFADQQAALTQTLEGQAPALRNTRDAMGAFGAVLGPLERQVAGGSISLDTLQFKLVDLARATGLATKPWDDYNAGLITIDEAMARVINQASDAGPAFDELRKHQDDVGRSTAQNALDFLQLALNFGKVAPAADAASSAGQSIANAMAAAGNALDPLGGDRGALLQQAAAASRDLAAALGEADGGFAKIQASAHDASGSVREMFEASKSLGDYLNDHTFKFHVDLPDVPDWFKPGSPTPFERGLWGIHKALTSLHQVMGPSLRSLPMPSMQAPTASNTPQPSGGVRVVAERRSKERSGRSDQRTINFYLAPGESPEAVLDRYERAESRLARYGG